MASTAGKATVYNTGHVKRNPDNGAVAIRTVFDPEQFPHMVWLIATTGSGAQNASRSDIENVEAWDDLYTPPEVVASQAPSAPAGNGGTGATGP